MSQPNSKQTISSGSKSRRKRKGSTNNVKAEVRTAEVIVTDERSNTTPVLVNTTSAVPVPDLSNFVSKDQLRKESFAERMQWWYKDLDDQWKRIAVQFLALLMIALVIWGMREGILKVASVTEGLEVITSGIAIVMMLFGLQAQTSVLRMPAGKSKAKLKI